MYRWHGFAVDAYDMQLMPVTCIDAYDMLHLMPIAMRAQHVACTISQAPLVYPSHTSAHTYTQTLTHPRAHAHTSY